MAQILSANCKVDGFSLEYSTERSEVFELLRSIKDQIVVVRTYHVEVLRARREGRCPGPPKRRSLSCGFSPTEEGSLMTEDE